MRSRISFTFIILAVAFLLSACAGGRGVATSWPGISTQDETVYLAFGSHVFALDAANGNQKWQFPVEPDRNTSFFAAPILTRDNQLIIGGYDNILYSLNPSTGQENTWSFEGARNRFISSPLITEEGIFAPSADGRLYAMDLNGNQLWEPFNTGEGQWAQPTSDGETIFLTGLDHNLYAIDMQTGRENWRIDLGGAIVGKPVLNEEGTVYVGNFAKKLVAVNTSTGTIHWEFDTKDWIWSGPALGGNTLYFGDISGTFYALDADSGREKWRFEANGGIYGTPLITEKAIYFATEAGTLYAFSPEQEQLWSREYGGKIYTSPTSVDNLILVASLENDTLLMAVDEDGSTRWSFTPENQ